MKKKYNNQKKMKNKNLKNLKILKMILQNKLKNKN